MNMPGSQPGHHNYREEVVRMQIAFLVIAAATLITNLVIIWQNRDR